MRINSKYKNLDNSKLLQHDQVDVQLLANKELGSNSHYAVNDDEEYD